MLYSYLKRWIDIIISIVGLILLSPIIIICSLLVLISMGLPVFFVQRRPGRYEKPFNLVKFRSMRNAYDQDGVLLPDNERITKVGAFLRKFSLDELPELWNVLKGEMSLVGPRPLLVRYLPYFSERERRRFLVRPGITGLAQISGRNLASWETRLQCDEEYANNLSLILDIKIIVKTFGYVILSRDVVSTPDAYMDDFDVHRKKQWEQRDDTSPET